MKLTLDIPNVSECEATACAYNVDRQCHARAITVGDGVHAACDTFLASESHVRDSAGPAGVGACKVSACRHNEDLECRASSIRIGIHEQHADCATFEHR